MTRLDICDSELLVSRKKKICANIFIIDFMVKQFSRVFKRKQVDDCSQNIKSMVCQIIRTKVTWCKRGIPGDNFFLKQSEPN